VIANGVTPLRQSEGFLDTSTWNEHKAVIAKTLPNPGADRFWRELSRIHSVTAHHIRPWLTELAPGAQIPPESLDKFRKLADAIALAYESLTGEDTGERLSIGDSNATQTAAREP
jgi:hypothetical protein